MHAGADEIVIIDDQHPDHPRCRVTVIGNPLRGMAARGPISIDEHAPSNPAHPPA